MTVASSPLIAAPAVIRGLDLPPPAEGLLALAPVFLVLLLVSVVSVVRRRRARSGAGRRRVGFLGRMAASSAIGNLMLDLNAMLDPSRPTATVTTSAEEDLAAPSPGDERDPPDPAGLPRPPAGSTTAP